MDHSLRIDAGAAHAEVLCASHGGEVVLVLRGDLCTATTPGLAGPLRDWLTRADVTRIVVDATGVEFIDGRGVELLVALDQWGNAAGRTLQLGPVSRSCGRLHDICNLRSLHHRIEPPDRHRHHPPVNR